MKTEWSRVALIGIVFTGCVVMAVRGILPTDTTKMLVAALVAWVLPSPVSKS